MNCPYCSASNAEDDHRCKRCGRRVGGAAPRYQHSAAAPAIDFEPGENQAPSNVEAPAQARRPVYQPSLFASPRVVSFESFAPESVETPSRKDAPRKNPSRPREKTRKASPGQQSFGFDQQAPAFHGPTAPMEPMIVCDAPVAVAAHRVIAAALDISMVVIAISLFSLIFHLAGGTIVLNKHTLPLIIGIACVFFLLYKILWCFADGDTAGMRWAHLRIVNFDGQRPEREQRFYRMAAGFLSLLAAGLGLLWALVDEESLTWHDHISKTFPTPY